MVSALSITDLRAGYGEWPVLDGLGLEAASGTITGIVGMNGAGKTTLLDVIAGRLRPMSGTVEVSGETWSKMPTYKRIRRGLAYVPEGRGLVRDLTVMENLSVAGADLAESGSVVERAFEMFPNLARRKDTRSADLSGGEQQMLAITRALVRRPKLILLDEPTLGLAPIMVENVATAVREAAAATGAAILVVEQNVKFIEDLVDRKLILRGGRLEEIHGTLGGDLKEFLQLDHTR